MQWNCKFTVSNADKTFCRDGTVAVEAQTEAEAREAASVAVSQGCEDGQTFHIDSASLA